MWLANKTIHGRSISHPLDGNKFPEKLDEKRLDELVTRLRAGEITRSEKEEIYKGHIRIAINIVSRYAIRYFNKVDDLVSESMLGIAYALDKAPERLRDNGITPYIVTTVHGFIYKYITRDFLVRSDYRTCTTKLPEQRSINLEKELDKKLSDPINIAMILDMLDFIINLEPNDCQRELKRTIIHLRKVGYNDQEIADMLNFSKKYIHKLRSEIKRKYKFLMSK
jgi:hypothetical protein